MFIHWQLVPYFKLFWHILGISIVNYRKAIDYFLTYRYPCRSQQRKNPYSIAEAAYVRLQ